MHSLLASFHLVSIQDNPSPPSSLRSVSPYQSDDEVVWSLSNNSASAAEPGSQSEASDDDDDDDFVLLNKPRIRKASRSLSNERDDQLPGLSQNSTAPTIDTTTRAGDLAQAGNDASPCTPGDRTAMVTPIPPSERRSANWTAKRATRPPPIETPSSASILASYARDQRKLTRATRRKAAALKKEVEELKKEAQAASAAAAATKATISGDEEQARKERRKAARQRRKERRRLQKRQATKPVPPVSKATPATPKVITTTTSPEMYKEASRFITSCVNFNRHLDHSSILD